MKYFKIENGMAADDISALYFNSFVDVLNRLNMILLEIRHLQENIIYMLRSPSLYRPLRFEENYLWGMSSSIKDFIFEPGEGDWKSKADALSASSIIAYPRPWEESPKNAAADQGETKCDSKTSRKEIKYKLYLSVSTIWKKSHWNKDQRRHYHALCASQTLKRNVFSDKLFIAKEGSKLYDFDSLRSVHHSSKQRAKLDYSRFLLIRSGVINKIVKYVSFLGDLQESYSKAQDMALQDHPRPSMERRREQRMYTTILSERCIEYWTESKKLLSAVFGLDVSLLNREPDILHRWHHESSSKSNSMFDDVVDSAGFIWSTGQDKEGKHGDADLFTFIREEKGKPWYTHFIDTSYFMQERPDLQSIIAHEVAHSVLRDFYDDFEPQKVSQFDDSFHRLIKHIGQCLDLYNANQILSSTQYATIKEIMADLIAISVVGPSYLFAAFLELLGSELSTLLFSSGKKIIDLRMVNFFKGASGHYDQRRGWYIRLFILCIWIEQYYWHTEAKAYSQLSSQGRLAVRMAYGIRTILDDMLLYLDSQAHKKQPTREFWQTISSRLSELVRHSEAPRMVGKWWKAGAHDFYGARGDCKGHQEWSAQMFPFIPKIQEHVWSWFDHSLQQQGLDPTSDFYAKVYGIERPDKRKKCSDIRATHDGQIFQYLQDIPWQYAFLSALGRLKARSEYICPHKADPCNGDNRRCAVRTIFDYPFAAREGYQIPLEFHYRMGESARLRLEEACRLLMDEGLAEDDRFEVIVEKAQGKLKKLEDWLGDRPGWVDQPQSPQGAGGLAVSLRKDAEHKSAMDWLLRDIVRLLKQTPLMNPSASEVNHAQCSYKAFANRLEVTARVLLDLYYSVGRPQQKKALEKLDPWRIRRAITRVMGYKLGKLYDILKEFEGEARAFFAPLKQYMGMFAKLENKLDMLLSAFTIDGSLRPMTVPEVSKPIPQYILGRISVGSVFRIHKPYTYATPGKKNGSQYRFNETFFDHHGYEKRAMVAQALVGRYDMFVYGHAGQGQRFLPELPWQAANGKSLKQLHDEHREESGVQYRGDFHYAHLENFLPYFVRWQLAQGVRLKLDEPWPEPSHMMDTDTDRDEPFLALLSVTVKHCTSRLNFLYRLLEVAKKSEKIKGGNGWKAHCVEDLEGFFIHGDKAFLADGWEDLLFMFAGDIERIEDVFVIQRVLYEDFQVDRTELILTPKALDCICKENNTGTWVYNKKTRLRVMFRIMDDWGLRNADLDFVKELKENIIEGRKEPDLSGATGTTPPKRRCFSSVAGETKPFPFPVVLSRTPGRMDFSMRVETELEPGADPTGIHKIIMALVAGTQVDRVQTNLGWVEHGDD